MLKNKELSKFFHGMYRLVRAGVNTPEALQTMSRQYKGDLREAMELAAISMKRDSQPLSKVLDDADIIPKNSLHGIRAGEMSGKLENVLLEMSVFHGRFSTVIKEATPKILTPLIYIFVAFAIFTGFTMFVFPILLSDQALANETGFIVSSVRLAESVKARPHILIAIAIALVLVVLSIIKSPAIQAYAFRTLFKIPLIGTGLYELYIAMWAKFYAIMEDAGIQYSEAVKVTQEIMPEAMEEEFELLHQIALQHNAELLKNESLIPEQWPMDFVAALQVGFPTGTLHETLSDVAPEILQSGAERIAQFAKISNLIGLAVVGVMVASLVMSIMMMTLGQLDMRAL